MTADDQSGALPRISRWLGFIALCVGMFMSILDIQVVVTSLAVIQDALAIGADQMSWIQTAYIIAEVIAIPITGLLLRVFSMRWLFASAIVVFTLASIGCASSFSFESLLAWRVIQGFAGGVLIPLTFSAVFLLLPSGFEQSLASTVGGVLAVLAPAVGPLVGGWITETYTWHWLFLINVVPGILACAIGLWCLPAARVSLRALKGLDWLSLVAFGLALALLVVGLKEAPGQGWFSSPVVLCLSVAAVLLAFSVMRRSPAIQFNLLQDRALAFGCAFSMLLGLVLFSAVYVMPAFLAFVRLMGPYEIGLVTIVMGLSQLFFAPITAQIDRFIDARWLTALGFAIFGAGVWMDSNLTVNSGYDDVFWPQVVRGAAVVMCILPPIRLAMAHMPKDSVGEASGLFNLSRNIGGIFGIAASDTILFGRTPLHADALTELLTSDPTRAAPLIGMAPEELPDAEDAMGLIGIMDQIQAAALTTSVNECWIMMTVVCGIALALTAFVGPLPSAKPQR
jgi:MFS transporter, DHA2 family, multidrug resistance protein